MDGTIDELKDILAEENDFIVTELKEVEKENYIRENSKWEVILKLEYIEDDDCDDCSDCNDKECDSDCSGEGHECSCSHHHEEEHQCSCSHHSEHNHQCSCSSHDDEVKQNDELTFTINAHAAAMMMK